jgi:Kef-type K+ transport system membrane component KefB
MFLSLGALLAVATLFGNVARRFKQPAVLGELLAGILLGPTVFGVLSPDWFSFLFPTNGGGALALDALATLSIVLFLLVAGMEVELSTFWRQGKTASIVGAAGITVPFTLGFIAAWLGPQTLGMEPAADPFVFALFIGTALSISALPVIAKTLMDLNLYRTELGMIVVAAAMFNDLIGWIIFAVILGMIGASADNGLTIGHTIWLILAYAALMLTIGRWLIHHSLRWVQHHSSWPGGILGFALSLALFGAAFTEWVGVHAVFGSFLVGIAIGDSSHLGEQTRAVINQFVSFIFAPLFFASIGLKTNFAVHFDWALTLIILIVACLGKVGGCSLAARLGGTDQRQAWAIGFAMNSRGAMEIILALSALQYSVIRERMFVALVVLALVTSLISGPMMQYILRRKKHRELAEPLTAAKIIQKTAANE